MRGFSWRKAAVAAFAAGLLSPAGALAQDAYPSRPIHVMIGYTAGSGADLVLRPVAEQLGKVSGATIVVDNKPGNGGNLSLVLAASAKPDGYTILLGSSSNIVGARYLVKDFPVDTERDLIPTATFLDSTHVFVVSPKSPVKSIPELIAYLKANDKTKYGYATVTQLVAGNVFLSRAGVTSTAVAYKTGADAIPDVVDGTLDFFVLDGSFGAGLINGGKVRGLALTSARRHPTLAGIPTMEEAGIPKYNFAPWFAAYVPAGTPPAIVSKIAGWVTEVMKTEDGTKHLAPLAAGPFVEDAEATRKHIRSDIEDWGKVVEAAGIKPQ